MAEKLSSNQNDHEHVLPPERHEVNQKTDKLSALEQAEQEHKARQLEREALEDAQDLAETSNNKSREAVTRPAIPAERRRGAPSKKLLEKSFKAQIRSVQTDLDPSSRILSKVLHAAPIEKVTNTVAATLARPNAMLSGSIAAFLSITVLYFVARYFGYRLSGFEAIAAFAGGWLLGIFYDYISHLLKKR